MTFVRGYSLGEVRDSGRGRGMPPFDHRIDGLPEGHDYRDEGCQVAPRCLECPLPRCRYDVLDNQGAQKPQHAMKSLGMARALALRAAGMGAAAIAVELGYSKRTVLRWFEEARVA